MATVVAGTGTYSTAHSIHLTERAHELGVDGFLVVTPYYNKPPQRGIVAHVEAIAAATDRPVVFYDIPSRVVVDVEPATISRLAEIENVRAVKQAKPSIEAARHVVALRARPLRGRRRPDPPVPRGRRRRGHLRPHARRRPAGEGADRELPRGRRRAAPTRSTRSSAPRSSILRVQTNPIAIKRALKLLGHEVGGLRLPLVEADEAETSQIRDCLERLGLVGALAV